MEVTPDMLKFNAHINGIEEAVETVKELVETIWQAKQVAAELAVLVGGLELEVKMDDRA